MNCNRCKPIPYIVLVLWLLLSNCSHTGKEESTGEPLKNKFAKGFEIVLTNRGYIVRVNDPAQNSKNNQFTYKLTRDRKRDGEIQIPVKRVICCSTSHIAFISALHESDKLVGVSGGRLIFDTSIYHLFCNGKIREIGYENAFDMEAIVSLQPDVIFAYGIDNNSLGNFQKVESLGIPVVWVGEYLESDMLGRTEWLKFFSCFFDKLSEAQTQYDSIADRYGKLQSEIMHTCKHKPMVITGLPWRGTWFVPGGKSYFSSLIQDACGNYFYANNNHRESVPVSMEEVFVESQQAEVWLNPNQCNSKEQILAADARLITFAPIQNSIICNNNKRLNENGGNDFWESGFIHPDIILKDLIQIFHSDTICNDSLFYYRKL